MQRTRGAERRAERRVEGGEERGEGRQGERVEERGFSLQMPQDYGILDHGF